MLPNIPAPRGRLWRDPDLICPILTSRARSGIFNVYRERVKTWIATREDLILSKLVWAKDSESELQQRDVRSLIDPSVDRKYVEQWAKRLGVDALLTKVVHE